MLVINTCNNKLAAARADFLARGMLHGTCLGDAIQLWNKEAGMEDVSDFDDNNNSSGLDSNGENSLDLDDDDEGDEDDGLPGPVNGPPVFSEFVLTQRKGIY